MKVKENVKKVKTNTDIICVIDISGSMGGSKLQMVLDSFNTILKHLGDNDRLSIVTFESSAQRWTPLLRMTESGKDKIRETVKKIKSRGGTNINSGLSMALDILQSRKHRNQVASIMLLSDGQDGSALNAGWRRQYDKDCNIHSFGYGSDHDPQLMTSIADVGDGNFYYIDKLDAVEDTFIDALGSLISSVAKNVSITISETKNDAGVSAKINKVMGDVSMWDTDKTGAYTTTSNYLMSGSKKDYVFEITIPKHEKSLEDHEKQLPVIEMSVEMKGLDDKTVVKKGKLQLSLINEGEEFDDDKADNNNAEVSVQFYRVRSAEVMDEARKLADANQLEKAQAALKAMLEELSNSFIKEEQFIVGLISDLKQLTSDLNP
jgi:uncharacterized protein YegL